jgi:hypothetical protein
MAFCSNCGTNIVSSKFCSNCGTPVVGETKSSVEKQTGKPEKEIDIAEFTDGKGCKVKLTSEKIYAKSFGLEETYALRSVDGAGVFDDQELFAREKLEAEKKSKSKKTWGTILMIFGGLGFFGGIMAVSENPDAMGGLVGSIAFFVFGIVLYNKSKEALDKVKLKSYIKIIISGSNKLFLFDKNAPGSAKVAEFLEKVEDTLTRYN